MLLAVLLLDFDFIRTEREMHLNKETETGFIRLSDAMTADAFIEETKIKFTS